MKNMGRAVVLAATLAAAGAGAETLSIQVREATLRASPSALGAPVGAAKYTEPVTVEERRGGWVRVRTAAGATGWVHESAVTAKRLVLRAGDETVATGASVREVALAGKGFNEEIEQAFRKGSVRADYSWVDRMEALAMPTARIAAFLREGGVAPKGGAR
jgi:hypothetical protein